MLIGINGGCFPAICRVCLVLYRFFFSVFKTEYKSQCRIWKLCLGQMAELIEKQRRETDFLMISLKTIFYIKSEKTSCEENFAKRTKFFDHVRVFQNCFF